MEGARLDIYVEEGCLGCKRAVEMAEWVRECFPSVKVRVVDPQREMNEQSRLVRATPSYFLNGAEFSLGNPSKAELEGALVLAQGKARGL